MFFFQKTKFSLLWLVLPAVKGGVQTKVIFTVGFATEIVFGGCHILLILFKGTCCTSILGMLKLKSKPILIGRRSVARSQKDPTSCISMGFNHQHGAQKSPLLDFA